GGGHRRPRAGTAFEEEHGIRRPVGTLRRKDDDLQPNLAPGAGLPILEHLIAATERLAGSLRQSAGGELAPPGRRWLRRGRGGRPGRYQEGGESDCGERAMGHGISSVRAFLRAGGGEVLRGEGDLSFLEG